MSNFFLPGLLRYGMQGIAYALVALLIGALSVWPSYTHFPPDKAQIKLSLVHGAKRAAECRRLTQDELAELAPNMRKAVDCPRQRLPVWVEVLVDGQVLYQAFLPPTGITGDGPSRVYETLTIEPGARRLQLRLRDTARTSGYDFELDRIIELRPQQNLGIVFRPEIGGFILL